MDGVTARPARPSPDPSANAIPDPSDIDELKLRLQDPTRRETNQDLRVHHGGCLFLRGRVA